MAADPKSRTRSYIVLCQSDVDMYVVVGQAVATSAQSAIDQVVSKLAPEKQDGNYVAPLAKSFEPIAVARKVESKLVFGKSVEKVQQPPQARITAY